MRLLKRIALALAVAATGIGTSRLAQAAEAPPGTEKPADHAKAIDTLIAELADKSLDVRARAIRAYQAAVHQAGRPGAEAERAAAVKTIAEKLGSELPKPAVLVLLGALEHIGRDDAVPRLAAFIRHADPLVRERARCALLANPGPKALEPLRAALADAEQPAWRIGLINALGTRRDKAAVQTLLPLAASDDQAVRTAAIEALACIGDKAGAAAIAAASARAGQPGGSHDAWNRAMVAYLTLADRLCEGGERAYALAMYRHILEAPGHLKAGAVIGLGRAGGAAELPAILAFLNDKSPRIRSAAKAALDLLPVEEVTRAVAAKAQAASPEMKALLLEILARRGDKSVLPAFLAAAEDADASVRTAAYRGLGGLADPRAMAVLLAALTKAAGKELAAARAAVSRIHGPAATQALIDAMANAAPKARVEVIALLADRRAISAVPQLLKAAEDKDATVRKAALKALGLVADDKALPALVRLLVQAKDRAAAEKAVRAVCRRLADPARCAPPLLAALDGASVAARCSLLGLLGRVQGETALAALRRARKDPEPKAADAAIRGLAAWNTPEALDDLLDVARTSADQTHRVIALRGYVRLAGLAKGRTAAQRVKLYDDAMAVAARPVDKKAVLAGIAALPNRAALRMAERCLGDEALKNEAAAAVVQIAKTLCGVCRKEAVAALEKASTVAADKRLATQARKLIAFIATLGDYLTAWEAAGPYAVEGKTGAQLFDVPFPPEKPGDQTAAWRIVPPGGYPKHPEWPWAIDLFGVLGGEERVAYLRTRIWSPNEQKAVIELGSDDGCKAWLNGKLIHTAPKPRSLKPGEDKLNVTLAKGWNILLLKVAQGAKDWGAAVRLRTPQGAPLDGLRADPHSE